MPKQGPFDAEIAKCDQRIAQHVERLATLAGHPDGGPAREMVAKLLESERNFRDSLQARRDAPRPARQPFSADKVTWPLVLVMVVAFIAGYFFLPHRPH